mmetsp:Transcript_19895/g.29767  ORF Transcript_19895/g.29767 Transcript_19895/m.29767 type:complete len:172 (+) Transcript_19895:909-1424(+)
MAARTLGTLVMAAICASAALTSGKCVNSLHSVRSVRSALKFRRMQSSQNRGIVPRAGDGGIKGAGPFNAVLNQMYSKMQEATKSMKEDLEKAEYEGFSSDETVRVVLSGTQQPKLIDVTQAAVDQGADKLQQLVVEASKDAYKLSKAGQEARMKKYFADMGLPMPPGGLKM